MSTDLDKIPSLHHHQYVSLLKVDDKCQMGEVMVANQEQDHAYY